MGGVTADAPRRVVSQVLRLLGIVRDVVRLEPPRSPKAPRDASLSWPARKGGASKPRNAAGCRQLAASDRLIIAI
jgi:hypothetical protein